MTGPCRARLRTVAPRGLRDGCLGVPRRVSIPGLRDFRKGVLALAAVLRQPRNQAAEEPA